MEVYQSHHDVRPPGSERDRPGIRTLPRRIREQTAPGRWVAIPLVGLGLLLSGWFILDGALGNPALKQYQFVQGSLLLGAALACLVAVVATLVAVVLAHASFRRIVLFNACHEAPRHDTCSDDEQEQRNEPRELDQKTEDARNEKPAPHECLRPVHQYLTLLGGRIAEISTGHPHVSTSTP